MGAMRRCIFGTGRHGRADAEVEWCIFHGTNIVISYFGNRIARFFIGVPL